MINFFRSLKYIRKSGIWIPFKIRNKDFIHVGKNVDISLQSRVVVGTDPDLPFVSRKSANIYFADNSKIVFGQGVVIGPGVNLVVKNGAKLNIGSNTYFTSDAHIEVNSFLVIGSGCAISWGVTIIDDDHHQLILGNENKILAPNNVMIGNKVWIGCNVTILKNTSIGNNSVIAANSLVKGVFPNNCLIAGNPAKIVKQNIDWK